MIATAEKLNRWVFGSYNVLFPQENGAHLSKFSTGIGYPQLPDGSIVPNTEWAGYSH